MCLKKWKRVLVAVAVTAIIVLIRCLTWENKPVNQFFAVMAVLGVIVALASFFKKFFFKE